MLLSQVHHVAKYWSQWTSTSIYKKEFCWYFGFRKAHLVKLLLRFKIRPQLTKLNETCIQIPLKSQHCVDKQICWTKARNNLKRYNPKKAGKSGYKVFVLCGTSGFAYNFEVEFGAENIIEPGEPNLDAASNVVMKMTRYIPRN